MRIEQLGDLGDAPAVLAALARAASAASLPPPAALLGDWFGSRAVIAPSVAITPVAAHRAFDVEPGAGDAVGGGWFGYLSYPDSGADGRGSAVPDAAGGWSDHVLRQDRDGCWWFESLSGTAPSRWLLAAVRAPVTASRYEIAWRAPDRDVHRRGVTECLAAIAAGEVYQACICTQFTGRLRGAPIDFFLDVAARTTPARAAYLAGDWGAVASLSPELFLRRHGTAVTSSPIKGTLPRSADPAALRASVKDVAENIMIVDLVRNDLGRVAVTGSVTAPELLAVRPAPGVWHLVSTVAAQVAPDLPMRELLGATFPPASVTGTPKGRARELLRRWEPARRGVYCGTVGLASPVAGCELNVAIRTVQFGPDGAAVLGVGGGITADSDPDREWEECLHKAASIVGPDVAVRQTRTTAQA
ncbi:aminodeoxychorismate synthase component I [Mycobacterium sp. PS03-16]|uniref:aminodeoxychorismate synthase component I n=1 Tax=Mycobacterium sp. PS03-16 TaxID=2559611 RepID=UPI001072F01F|nr:aminodeoxychorismate synthase component I [Mycobacterium sp. PS03-16]TFV61062.1 aminodeoxychorismate synthase component I [Mycobacterium sp. PS03-16]